MALGALVDQRDLQPAGEERRLAHALGERLVVELEGLEDLGVGEEGDGRAGALDLLALRELVLRLTALVVLLPAVALAADVEVEALGERVDDRDADSVQAAGDLVAPALAELAAGVKVVSTTSAAGRFSSGCSSTGMPRPSSVTVTLLSGWIVISISSQWPARASSTELSTTS